MIKTFIGIGIISATVSSQISNQIISKSKPVEISVVEYQSTWKCPECTTEEQYVLKQDSLTIYERLRPAAENLYLSLVERFPEFIGPFLVQTILHKHESSVFDNNNSGGDNNSVTRSPSRINACKLDGVYLAIGLNAYALNQHLNFGEWFMNRLGK